jgi:hypothetical protein
MDSRQIVLVSTAEFSVLNTGILWREAKTKRLFSQCVYVLLFGVVLYKKSPLFIHHFQSSITPILFIEDLI